MLAVQCVATTMLAARLFMALLTELCPRAGTPFQRRQRRTPPRGYALPRMVNLNRFGISVSGKGKEIVIFSPTLGSSVRGSQANVTLS